MDFTPKFSDAGGSPPTPMPDGEVATVPEWFAHTMPPFLDSDEMWVEYQTYLKSVTEPQWHGLVVDGNVRVVLRERIDPTVSMRIEDTSAFGHEWGTTELNAEPSVGVISLAGRLLDDVLLPVPTSTVGHSALIEAFSRLIVGRLPVAEWRLTDAFIIQWCSLYKEKYLS